MLTCALFLLACAERFRNIGVGRCMYNGEFMQGLAGTLSGGHEHLQCRNMCSYVGNGCVAFSWNHCTKECVLHGLPSSFSNVNTSGWVSWGSADGCPISPMMPHAFMSAVGGSFPAGGKDPSQFIQTEGGPCSSSACFLHEKPCKVDRMIYSNGAYLRLNGLFAPGEVTEVKCPEGYGGVVSLQCSGVGEMIRLTGWCGLHCEKQALNLSGLKRLEVTPRKHGQFFDPGCSALIPNTHGDLVLICNDNAYVTQGFCGKNCAATQTEDGNFTIAASLHGVRETRPCPDEYSGSITVECANQVVKSIVMCRKNCPSETMLVDTIGSVQVEFLVLDRVHDETTVESCPAGYTGELEILCFDGVLSSVGVCGLDCSTPGMKKFGPVEASWSEYLHHNEISELDCAEGGTIFVRCHGGVISAAVEEDGCYFRCESHTFVNNGKRTDLIPAMVHGENVTVECPTGSTGELLLQCRKGFFRYVDGFCGLDCEKGVMVLPSGVRVSHEHVSHGGRLSGVCEAGFKGNVEVSCNNAVTEAITGNCQPDIPDCESLIQIVYENQQEIKTWFDDQRIEFRFDVSLKIGENKSFACPSQWGANNVIVKCVTGPSIELIGSCGFPCGFDRDTGVEIPGSVPPRIHGEEYNESCGNPLDLELEVVRRCVNGELEIIAYCGNECDSDALDGLFEGMLKPDVSQVVPHSLNITAPCDASGNFSGSPVMVCINGTFQGPVEGECGLRCIDETLNINMDHLEVEELSCDAGFSGRQMQKCNNSIVEFLPPECYADCTSYSYVEGIVRPPGPAYWEKTSHHGTETLKCSDLANDPFIEGTVGRKCDNGYGIISHLSCHRHCIDASLDSPEYNFPIKISRLNHSQEGEYACGHPLFTQLWSGFFSLLCVHGELSVTQFGCESHCIAGIVMSNGIEVPHELIELNTTVLVSCDHVSEHRLTVTCVNQLVTVIQGWCFHFCAPGVLDGYAHKHLKHLEHEYIDCSDGYTGTVKVECDDGVASIKDNQCTAHCGQSVVYPGGPPVAVLPVKHGAVHTVPCERGFTNVQCDNGRLELLDMHAEMCGYTMPLCACCPNTDHVSTREQPSLAIRPSFFFPIFFITI